MAREYKRCGLTVVLKQKGKTLKAFADWLGKSQEGVIKRYNRESQREGGISKELTLSIEGFMRS